MNKALLDAARDGRTADAVAYVRRGASPDAEDPDGKTILRMAGELGNPKLWRSMIALGGSPRIRAADGASPEDVRRIRWAAGRQWGTLVAASEGASPDALSRILACEPGRLLGRDRMGMSLLHFAGAAGRGDNMEALTRAGGDPHEPDDLGRTPWLELSSAIFFKTEWEGPEARDAEEFTESAAGLVSQASAALERERVAMSI